ncbi:MAG: indole-3-glycerol phosphate synthase TrpC [Oscillospiraceae bacterium]|nr:indole-3-glycerol phosphate synthase TrpC [Oscillospiraceae bacterium]
MILDKIAAAARERVARSKRALPFQELRRRAEALPSQTGFPFQAALAAPGLSFICEVKKASPSKGLIAEAFPYAQIAAEYERAGAAAISVLTEPDYFQGSDKHLKEIAEAAGIPVLRKDFTVDPYQIYEARLLGASAVLLICALLDKAALKEYYQTAASLGLSALTEVHDESEALMAAEAGVPIIGVNNRDLRSFEVDLRTCERLRPLIPAGCVFVAESGIRGAKDIAYLRKLGADAVLIGETLMRSSDKTAALKELRG